MAGRGVFFFVRGGTGRLFFFPRRDGAVVFFFRGGTGRLFFFSEAGRGGFFFFFDGTGRGGVFFFFRGPGRDGCFWRWHFFWRDGAKSLHRPAKGGLNRPASRPCKALKSTPSLYCFSHIQRIGCHLEKLPHEYAVANPARGLLNREYIYMCVCVFIKLHITAQSGLVILVILCHSH